MANRSIGWSKNALKQFEDAINYISQDSPQNAEKVRSGIINNIQKIPSHPESFPPDKFKLNNNGRFRAFELYRLRISYYYDDENIRILRVRHTSREPKNY
ncbi:MAG: type II toxin-antitoxin system RelE/ParE family toxin [Ginsengibacter sp.]